MPRPQFHLGDVVRFKFGLHFVQGVVKEDRGEIGMNGRRLYRIEFLPEPGASIFEIELPAVDLELVKATVPTE